MAGETGDLHAKLDELTQLIAANHTEVRGWIFGGPDGPGIVGRIQPLEQDMATAKKAIAVGGAGLVAVLWDSLKKKIGI